MNEKIKVKSDISIEIEVTLKLTLQEARALNQITKYGVKSFLEGYYKQLGKSYLEPHEKGVISLFGTIKQELPSKIRKAEDWIAAIVKIEKPDN